MLKIACCGTHCAGKSTLTYQIAEHFKRCKSNVYVIHETIRKSPFPANAETVPETPLWNFTYQVTEELSAIQRGYEIIVCDRSCYDAFIYAEYFKMTEDLVKYFRDAALEWIRTYDFLFFVRPNMPIISDGFRAEDECFQKKVDELFETFFNNVKVKRYIEVTTTQIHKKEINFHDIFTSL